jgi:hypothetical protein
MKTNVIYLFFISFRYRYRFADVSKMILHVFTRILAGFSSPGLLIL